MAGKRPQCGGPVLVGLLGALLLLGQAYAGERVPLEARYERTSTDGRGKVLRVERGSYQRDSMGRIRTTATGIVKITDFVSGDRITLHPAERRATLEALHPDLLDRPDPPPAQPVTQESIERFVEKHVGSAMPDGTILEDYAYLGVRLVDGIECHAHRTVKRGTDGAALLTTQCYSATAELTLETRHRVELADGTTTGYHVSRYLHIALREPAPELFRIPEDYVVTRLAPRWLRWAR